MKRIFFKPSKRKIIASLPFDKEEFTQKLLLELEGTDLRHKTNNKICFEVKNKVLQVNYMVEIDIHHRRIRYNFSTEPIIAILILLIFVGMLMFNGRPDTYFFWALVISLSIFKIDNILTRSRIENAIQSLLPKEQPKEQEVDISRSISAQYTCPACNNFINGFQYICPECGIKLSSSQESVSNLKNMRIKYFYLK